jgi:hypothetical protein
VKTGVLRQMSGIGFRKGLRGGNRAWLALGVVSWFWARQREKSRNPQPLYREVLRRGESIAVRILEPPR